MKKIIIGTFAERNDAEKFIDHIHNDLKVPHDDISYLYKDILGREKEVDTEEVSSKTTGEGAKDGAKIGGTLGAIAGIATVAGVIPIIGPFFVAGPLISALGITGAVGTAAAGMATGAAVGGVVGALANMGITSEHAKAYEDRVLAGDILVVVNSERYEQIEEEMENCNAMEVDTFEITV